MFTVEIQGLCKAQFMQGIYQKIDGAVLTSKNERNLDCVVTFQTLTVLQRFMLRFDRLRLDCNDHLYIYDVANAVGPYKVSSPQLATFLTTKFSRKTYAAKVHEAVTGACSCKKAKKC